MIAFLTDPVLRAPFWGCIFMCIASSLIGVCLFLRKRSLLSESMSHATYPGATLGVALFALVFPNSEEWALVAILGGAFISSLLGLRWIDWLEQKGKVRADAALCFVLAVFFGAGLTIASAIQTKWPVWHKQVQMLLFGQAATMTDIHIWIYGSLAVVVASFFILAFRPLHSFLFDRHFALSIGVPVHLLERILFWLLALSLIVGIRSVGVVLMSGMVIAPAVAARQYSNRLHTIFGLAALFGALSAGVGNYLSMSVNLPTGPAIVLVGTTFAFLSLLFAPKKGIVFRWMRILAFRLKTVEENVLKGIWRHGALCDASSLTLKLALWRLQRAGWLDAHLRLTLDGSAKAATIVRLHRLWELYLTERLGYKAEQVHQTAEEMEHILTPEMEQRLTQMLKDPKQDPHQQPIPEKK